MIRVLEKSGIQGPYMNIAKANIKLNGEKLEAIPLNQRLDKATYSM